MVRRLLSFFRKQKEPRLRVKHENLGVLIFDKNDRIWESEGDSFYYGGIPGDEKGPNQESVDFILDKLNKIDTYWDICTDDLKYIANQYKSIPSDLSIRDIYRVSAISLYDGYWEVCFETNSKFKWLYVGMQFEGETLVSNTIDT